MGHNLQLPRMTILTQKDRLRRKEDCSERLSTLLAPESPSYAHPHCPAGQIRCDIICNVWLHYCVYFKTAFKLTCQLAMQQPC